MAGIFTPKNLSEMIGAPLTAIVEGEAFAAQATAQFIREIGFEKTTSSTSDADLGQLRTITFRFFKANENGTSTETQIEMPLLSLIPIPAIQVKNATLDFAVQLTGFTENSEPEKTSIDRSKFLSSRIGSMKGIIAQRQNQPVANTDTSTGSFSMKINIELEQAGITLGLQNILNIMDRSLNEIPIKNVVEEDIKK